MFAKNFSKFKNNKINQMFSNTNTKNDIDNNKTMIKSPLRRVSQLRVRENANGSPSLKFVR